MAHADRDPRPGPDLVRSACRARSRPPALSRARAKTASEFDARPGMRRSRDRRHDRERVRPARRHRARARPAGARVVAVGQHDDVALRKRAWRAAPSACSPTASCSRTGPRRSRPGWRGPPPVETRRMTSSSGRPIPASRFAERLERAAAATEEAGLEAMLVGVGSDLRYLTGYEAMPLERLTLLVLRPGAAPTIVVPRLELAAAEAGPEDADRDPDLGRDRRPVRAGRGRDPGHGRVAVSDTMLAMHLLRIQARARSRYRVRPGVDASCVTCG